MYCLDGSRSPEKQSLNSDTDSPKWLQFAYFVSIKESPHVLLKKVHSFIGLFTLAKLVDIVVAKLWPT